MDFLNFINSIYFICTKVRSFLSFTPVEEISSIDSAIAYYSTDPKDLYSIITSSDISLIELHSVEISLKDYSILLRRINRYLEEDKPIESFISVKNESIYLKDFLIKSSDGDVNANLQHFFDKARRFLCAYRKLKPGTVNHRLASALVANVIFIKEVFESIEVQ